MLGLRLKEGKLSNRRVPLNFFDALKDVRNVDLLISQIGFASCKTLSRNNRCSDLSVTTSTDLPSSISRSIARPEGNHELVGPTISIKKSTSLSGRSSHRATLPKIRTFPAPCRFAIWRISSRFAWTVLRRLMLNARLAQAQTQSESTKTAAALQPAPGVHHQSPHPARRESRQMHYRSGSSPGRRGYSSWADS